MQNKEILKKMAWYHRNQIYNVDARLFPGLGRETSKEHLIWMCNKIEEYAESNIDKANRWLGYVQGVLVASTLDSVSNLREIYTSFKNEQS